MTPSPEAKPSTPTLESFLSEAPDLRKALRGIERAAQVEAPVLLLGEPGTGRTTLARAIHASSGRAEGPLVEVDAGTLPIDLVESELFGARAGAFTGAEMRIEGRVERAERGTLVLDHVEDIPLRTQTKLLRLLSEGVYAPLGAEERRADVRFVAIGPEDLSTRVERGTFRPELYFRLEVLAFRVPPLRERRRDLPSILERIASDLSRRFDRPGLRVGDDARQWMRSHPWPGNVRQLRNVLERDLVAAGETVLDPARPRGMPGEGRPRSLAEVEKEAIERALAHTRGHQGRAAELLGISRKTLWEKRKRYGIP